MDVLWNRLLSVPLVHEVYALQDHFYGRLADARDWFLSEGIYLLFRLWGFFFTVVSSLCLAASTFAIVYYMMVPQTLFEHPLYFDIRGSGTEVISRIPEPSTSIILLQTSETPGLIWGSTVNRFFSAGQPVNVHVDLSLPESPWNYDLGMFMIDVKMKSFDKLLHRSSRPCMIHYRSALLRTLKTIFFSFPLVMDWKEEEQSFGMDVVTGYHEVSEHPLSEIEVSLSQPIQFYNAKCRIEAHLTGIPWLLRDRFWITMPFCVLNLAVFFSLTIGYVVFMVIPMMFSESPRDDQYPYGEYVSPRRRSSSRPVFGVPVVTSEERVRVPNVASTGSRGVEFDDSSYEHVQVGAGGSRQSRRGIEGRGSDLRSGSGGGGTGGGNSNR
eukprot:Rmarinus@m.19575